MWVSVGRKCEGEDVAKQVEAAALEWCAINMGRQYTGDYRDETHGEGDAAQTLTYFKVLKD